MSDQEKLTYKYAMNSAISEYIYACTDKTSDDIDYSYINRDIDDLIDLLGGVLATEEC